MFDSFFEDVFNKDHNKTKSEKNNRTIDLNKINNPDFKVNITPEINLLEKNSGYKYKDNYNNHSLFKENKLFEDNINIKPSSTINALNKEIEKSLNNLNNKILEIEKTQEVLNKRDRVNSSFHNVDQANKSDSKLDSDKQTDSTSPQKQVNVPDNQNSKKDIHINANENRIDQNTFRKYLNEYSIAKMMKYSFYLIMALIIMILSILLVKFLLGMYSSEKPIKTKHSINEIEDELNNMKEREKLF